MSRRPKLAALMSPSERDRAEDPDWRLRMLWRRYCSLPAAIREKWGGMPEELRTLTCGARTRSGGRCKQRGLYRNGRCLFHGGLSTGPATAEGKARSAANGRLGGRPRKREPPAQTEAQGRSEKAPEIAFPHRVETPANPPRKLK